MTGTFLIDDAISSASREGRAPVYLSPVKSPPMQHFISRSWQSVRAGGPPCEDEQAIDLPDPSCLGKINAPGRKCVMFRMPPFWLRCFASRDALLITSKQQADKPEFVSNTFILN
jgi:hypothetical protein